MVMAHRPAIDAVGAAHEILRPDAGFGGAIDEVDHVLRFGAGDVRLLLQLDAPLHNRALVWMGKRVRQPAPQIHEPPRGVRCRASMALTSAAFASSMALFEAISASLFLRSVSFCSSSWASSFSL